MASLAEYFQAFHRYAVENELSASARNLYYTILGEMNARYWKVDKVSISVRDMQVLGGFQSSSAVNRAKTILGTENIVRISKLKNNKTQYELVEPEFWTRNTSGTPAEHLRHTSGTPALGVIPSRSITKNKTERQEDGGGRASASKAARIAKQDTAATTDDLKSLSSPMCSEKLRHCWIQNSGVNPNDGICLKLGELEQEHGAEVVKRAIEEANYSDDGGGINLKFVLSKLNQIVYGAKGESRSGKHNGNKAAWDD